MRVLAITKIFPNAAEPLSAPFNRQQFAALRQLCDLQVMATIPWFPGAGLLAKWSSAGKLAAVPKRDTIAGIDVTHPRTLFLPKLALATWGPLYAASIAPALHLYRNKVDVVLGSWAYPDGFAAIVAARLLGVPAVVKLHGSDINLIAKIPGPRRMMSWALPHAARVVAVSKPLAAEVVALGVPEDRVKVVLNGVDADLFHPGDRAAARAQLDLPADKPIAIYVGNLKPEKGVVDLGKAWAGVLAHVPDATLLVIGDGPLEGELEAVTAKHGERVRLIPRQPLERIPLYMAAADILVLPSHFEGTPNVVLEALASGRRVVATAVGGVPDLITDPALGTLVPAGDPDALGHAIAAALRSPYDPAEVARLGARGGWAASATALHAVLQEAAKVG
ncbi:MAG TPA: glycosyltransferase family 4 protein [Kofleriaceae bacterium]|nr:glycosyltransferase family 4 protein [Kofleriaceae bacterium]